MFKKVSGLMLSSQDALQAGGLPGDTPRQGQHPLVLIGPQGAEGTRGAQSMRAPQEGVQGPTVQAHTPPLVHQRPCPGACRALAQSPGPSSMTPTLTCSPSSPREVHPPYPDP